MSKPKKGMTLIEVLLALTIVATAMLSIAAYMTRFARTVATSDFKEVANELAASRIEEIKNAPRYSAIDSMYAKTESFSTSRYKGFSRQTMVARKGGGNADFDDYKTITVVVRSSHLNAPVRKTSIIAAF